MGKRVSARKIKIHNQYTYDQAADALGVSVQTLRLWRLSGLPVLDSQKPHLILGFVLKDFLNRRASKPERRLARVFLHGLRRPPGAPMAALLITRPANAPRGAGWRRCVTLAKGFVASLQACPFVWNWPQS